MKPTYFILALLLIPIVGISQGSNVLTSSNTKPVVDDRLAQCLWGYAKNVNDKSGKSLIDFNSIDNWRKLGSYLAVSNDAKFMAYTINKPTGTRYWYSRLDSLVIQSTNNDWRMAFFGSKPGSFTNNGAQYIFLNGDALYLLQLGNYQANDVKNVVSYKMSQHGRSEWLAYQFKNTDSNLVLNNLGTKNEIHFSGITEYNFDNSGNWLACKVKSNELLLYNLVTGIQKRIPFIKDYTFAGNGEALVLKTIEKVDNGTTTTLKYLNFPDWKEKNIWSSSKEKIDLGGYCIDRSGRQVVFSVQDNTGNQIWYYNVDTDSAILKVTNETPGIAKGELVTGEVSFTNNDRYVQFSLQPGLITEKPDSAMAQVEVWDHKDLYLPPTQTALSKQATVYNAFLNIENDRVLPVESDGKKVLLLRGDFAVVKKSEVGTHGDRFWEAGILDSGDSNWVVSLKDGDSHLLPATAAREFFWFSPGMRYLVYFDVGKGCHYFSYDLQTSEVKDLTANIPEKQLGFVNRYNGDEPSYGNLTAWIGNDVGVLVYDNYDIWRLDLTGREPAVNITNGFGQSTNTILYLLATNHYSENIPAVKSDAPLLLRAFNTQNKQNGFYRKPNLKAGDPVQLYMGGYFMNLVVGCQDLNLSNEGVAPLKARDRKSWIVQRQSATDAPNYYETTDFKQFRRITDFQPQKNYRWLQEELHAFTHLDGRVGQGILYKPEDFDSTKKYPVLIVFYGAYSDDLYQFPVPTYLDQATAPGKSPAWLVNNGYLVFTPDIYTTPLKYGQSAFNVIEGAAQYLKKLPYVDANKLGCASHSWSAKLGAYIFTHSSSFSATAISEGFLYANPINMALAPNNGISRLGEVELSQEYGSLWENKATWLEETTVLQVDKVKNPLLLFCNQESAKDYQDQTFQLFSALRRLDKDVWWLKYENGSHTLQDLKELKDYTIRYTQFFNHYLKEAPAPQWMTQGVPVKLKGIESRYALDPSGSCGKDCAICKKWNAQYKKHPEMFNQPIQDWRLE
jgi:dienelactone hydrolase